MKIRKVRIKNFYSAQNIELDLTNLKGIVMIEGVNKDTGGSNGSGKSILLEAMTWGLFGKSIRKSNEEAMVNFDKGKNCEVEITLDNGLTVKRTRRPSSLRVEQAGENYTKDSAIHTQKTLDSLLGTDYKTFMASIVFGQHSNIDFLSASQDDKRLIIKNFLNLENLFEWRDKIRPIKSEHASNIKVSKAVIESLWDGVTTDKVSLEKGKKGKKKPGVSLEDILDAESKIREIKKVMSGLGSPFDFTSRIKNCEYLISKGVYQKEISCHACGGPTVEEQTKKDIKDQEARLSLAQDGLKSLRNNLKRCSDEIKEITPKISSEEYSKNIELYNLSTRKSELEKAIYVKKEEIKRVEKQRMTAQRSYDVMRFWEKALSEQGVIRFVIRNILDFFNAKCNEYLSLLTNGNFHIEFNEELNEKITTNGKHIHHCSLSGGERRRINIAVMLSLQSLLQFTGKDTSDLLFFDEITENMDAEGTQGLYILLTELKKKNIIFLITHNDQLKSLLENSSKLVVIKRNGTTTLKQE